MLSLICQWALSFFSPPLSLSLNILPRHYLPLYRFVLVKTVWCEMYSSEVKVNDKGILWHTENHTKNKLPRPKISKQYWNFYQWWLLLLFFFFPPFLNNFKHISFSNKLLLRMRSVDSQFRIVCYALLLKLLPNTFYVGDLFCWA